MDLMVFCCSYLAQLLQCAASRMHCPRRGRCKWAWFRQQSRIPLQFHGNSIVFTRILFCLPLIALQLLSQAAWAESRQFTFNYLTRIGPIEAGAGSLHVFIPLAVTSDQQQLIDEQIDSSIAGVIETEERYGNRYWHGIVDNPQGQVVEVQVRSRVKRIAATRDKPASSRPLSEQERLQMAPYLQANTLVPVDHPVLAPILDEIDAKADASDPAALSRAIYDWVVDNVEYKKTGTGWGNGDTFWACNERYGNCTDFHALYISLARSRGIPARFEIGFPVPGDRPSGTIGGYHCWVEVYLADVGWFPIDASEASKHPEKREYFYGAHPENRIHFSSGRDLSLGVAQQSGPINYFVYPHVELGGERYTGPVETVFSYE